MKIISKRKKYKDNPYTLMIENDIYYVLFTDVKNIIHKIEVSEDVFIAFNSFELDDKKIMNEFDRHIEHSELSEITINKKAIIKSELVDESVEKNIEDELIKAAREVFKRKFNVDVKTFEQMDKILKDNNISFESEQIDMTTEENKNLLSKFSSDSEGVPKF